MKKILVVVDMQNDFITGPLGTPEAVSIVDKVVEKIRGEEWDYIYTTQDTHEEDYRETHEGKKLPIEHCIVGTDGWNLNDKIYKTLVDRVENNIGAYWCSAQKFTFGCEELLTFMNRDVRCYNAELTLVGVCTDICVISNALLLKAHYPEMTIVVDASCCAGSTPEKHRMALEVMKSCQVDVVNDEEDNNWIIITDLMEKMANSGYIISAEDTRKALAIAEEHPESTPAYLKAMHSEPYSTLLESGD